MKQVHFATAESGSPDSGEWHGWRLAGIGASDAATIAFNGGVLSPKDAAAWQRDYAGLLAEKRGEAREKKMGFAAIRGREMEAGVNTMVSAALAIPFVPAFGEMSDHPIIRSSFDGLTFDLDCILEIKVANQKVHEAAKAGEVFPYYRPQVAHQALTAWGHPEGWGSDKTLFFANYRETDEQPLAIAEFNGRADWLKRMAEALLPLHLAFWKEVEEGRALGTTAPTGIPPEVLAQIELFRELKAEQELVEGRIKEARAFLLAHVEKLGVPKWSAYGFEAVKQARKGSIDLDAACKRLGIEPSALEPFRGKETASWIVKIK